jgi:hypothetical protein
VQPQRLGALPIRRSSASCTARCRSVLCVGRGVQGARSNTLPSLLVRPLLTSFQLKDQFFGEVLTSSDETNASTNPSAAAAAAAAVSAHRSEDNIAGARARLSPNPQLQVSANDATRVIDAYNPLALSCCCCCCCRAWRGLVARCPCLEQSSDPAASRPLLALVRSEEPPPRSSASCAASLRCLASPASSRPM